MQAEPIAGIPEAAAHPILPLAQTDGPVLGGRCILVAEDDADDVFLLRRALQKAGLGHRLLDVADGQRVVEYLDGLPPFDDRTRYPFPDLLLLDLKMPRMSGLEVLQWLDARPDLKALPVVVLSSSPLEADCEQATHLGAREFQTKPGQITQLIDLLRSLHDRWLADAPLVPRDRWSVPRSQPGILARA
ncbi:MAG: two-component system response regulator [Verrucomicrobia bacterium]|nr:MAG: two-component system response regulator [Verrucomicrobiota bacterium]